MPTPRVVNRARAVGLACGLLVLGVGFFLTSLKPNWELIQQLRAVVPPGHYLVLFENNAELRPSGGFIGSFATLDVTGWGIANVAIDTNIYKRDNAFTEHTKITPPAPLAVLTDHWALRDSNWAADFRDAAAQAMWFYEREGGEPVDGVVAVTASVVRDFLSIHGPVTLPDGTRLRDDNVFDTLHSMIERGYFLNAENRRKNEPKAVLQTLWPRLATAALHPRTLIRVPVLLQQELTEKHLLLFHTDPAVQATIESLGWGGVIGPIGSDGIGLVNANLGGQKSSLFVEQAVALEINQAGEERTYRLDVTRTHTGTGVWPDDTNRNYLRVLLPTGATIVSIERDGREITEDVDRTDERGLASLGFWLTTPVQGVSRAVLSYRIAADQLGDPSTVTYWKQPGVLADQVLVSWNGDVVFQGSAATDLRLSLPD
ncbi:DUF4012 domain-containing protein [Candidatus Berkelbacteria bacterium]|nr:DUF4012 domain-containing protein [Candidatus Berkelbacteria bacterium]